MPSLPQWLQSGCRSEHLGAHSPHDVGHSLSIKSGDFVHSPSLAQLPQFSSRSEHMMEQTPQLCGHRPLTTSSVSHSPSRDQAAQEMSLSLQLQVCARAKSIRVSLKSGRVGVCGCRNRRNLAFGPPRMLTIRSSLARAAAQGAAARGGTWSREGSAQSTRRRAFGYSAVGRGHVAVKAGSGYTARPDETHACNRAIRTTHMAHTDIRCSSRRETYMYRREHCDHCSTSRLRRAVG